MERYELVEGSSSKFWEVGVEGETLTVRFGRIGTNGQTKDKDFGSEAAATKERDKLVKEKTGKGYVLVGEGAAPAPKPQAAAPAKAKANEEASAPDAPPLAAEPPAPAEPAPPSGPSLGPSEELEALLEKALPTRSRPGAPLDGPGAWKTFRDVLLTLLPKAAKKQGDAVAWLTERLGDGEPPAPLQPAEARAWLNSIDLVGGATLPETWVVKSEARSAHRACIDAFVQWLVASAGAAKAAETANKLRNIDKQDSYRTSSWSQPLDLAFRAALVKAPEEDYEAAIAFLTDVIGAEPDDWRLRAYFAFILADDRSTRHDLQPLGVLEAMAAAGEAVGDHLWAVPLVADSRPSAVAKWRPKKTYFLYMVYCDIESDEAAATLVATARHHGESALPGLDWLLHYANDAERTALAETILKTGEDGALGVLLPSLHEKWIRAAIDNRAAADPARTFAQLLAAVAAGRSEPALKARVFDAIERHGEETVRAWAAGDPKAANHLEKLLAARSVDLAPKEAWPAVLRDPPWRKKAKKNEDLILALEPIATPFAQEAEAPKPRNGWYQARARILTSMDELPAVLADIEKEPKQSWLKIDPPSLPLPAPGSDPEHALLWLQTRLTEISRKTSYAVSSCGWDVLYCGIEKQPEQLSLALWETTGAALGCHWYWFDVFPDVLARFGERALPGLVKFIESDPTGVLPLAIRVDAPEIAPLAARALQKLKKARAPAADWLRKHRRTAILRLIPDAVGKPGGARDAAEHTLRWFVKDREDGRAAVEAAAADYAGAEPQISEAILQVLDRDPLARFPNKIAKTPAWFRPSAVARPELAAGGALPDEALIALVEMLSFSTQDAVYGGIDIVRDETTPASRAGFAWDLFSAWLAEGAPAKDGWAMRAVGWLGDDECARQLTRLIRRWPGEAAHARAVTGLDVLVDIGSDVALMNLNGIAEKLKFKGLQDKAREKIAQLAEARDLTPEELSDRLAPDLDLDERGGVDLVFGERQFRAGFDEFLKPWVKDVSGARLKDLPKPNKADDAELSAAAVARWSALKKDARAVASLQIARLENMLSTSRRVKPRVFWDFFASHPLIRHLAQRLVWGVYGDDDPRTAPKTVFRVSDDLSVTDAEDDALDLDFAGEMEGTIGLVHPLHLPDGGLDKWGALFGDYEISQPFPQLGREVYELTDKEKASSEILRFDGVQVETARIRGMSGRGWRLGDPQDGGVIGWIERKVRYLDGTEGTVTLDFEGGLFTGASELEDKTQPLRKLTTEFSWYGKPSAEARTFGQLDPVTASELLRGPSLLAETGVG